MQKEAKLFTALCAVVAALLLFLLCVVLPLSLTKADAEKPTIPTEPGESAVGETLLLFGPYERETIESITVVNQKEAYSFVHPEGTNGSSDIYSFRVEQNGVVYGELYPDDTLLAQIVVAAGTPYVRTRVAAEEGKEIAYENYGLAESQNPTYYELKLFDGSSHKVYIGDPTSDGNSYFVRVEGRDTVYVTLSPTMGQTMNMAAGDFFKASLFPATENQYAYFFIDGFEIQSEIRDYGKNTDGTTNGRVVTARDTISVLLEITRSVDGGAPSTQTQSVRYNLAAAHTELAIKQLFTGLPVGEALSLPPSVKTEQISLAGGGTGTLVTTTTYKKIEYAAKRATEIGFDFIKDANDRDYFRNGSLYKITGPDSVTNYTADDNFIMTVLPELAGLAGTRVLHLGAFQEDGTLKDEYLEKYGLYRYTFTFRYPKKYELEEVLPDIYKDQYSPEDENAPLANTIVINESDYVDVTLYVSERQKDGTYYVATSVYGTISVCEAASLAVLEYPLSSWIDDRMLSSYMMYLSAMKLEFFYQDFSGVYDFDVSGLIQKKDEHDNWYYATIPLNGSQVDYKNFEETYYYLLWQYYAGETGLSDSETEAILQQTPLLRITVTLTDGRVFTYSFHAYSERRVLVSLVSSDDPTENSSAFYLTLPQVERLSEAFRLYEAGTPIDLRKGQD